MTLNRLTIANCLKMEQPCWNDLKCKINGWFYSLIILPNVHCIVRSKNSKSYYSSICCLLRFNFFQLAATLSQLERWSTVLFFWQHWLFFRINLLLFTSLMGLCELDNFHVGMYCISLLLCCCKFDCLTPNQVTQAPNTFAIQVFSHSNTKLEHFSLTMLKFSPAGGGRFVMNV